VATSTPTRIQAPAVRGCTTGVRRERSSGATSGHLWLLDPVCAGIIPGCDGVRGNEGSDGTEPVWVSGGCSGAA